MLSKVGNTNLTLSGGEFATYGAGATSGTLTATQIIVEKNTINPSKPRGIYLIGALGITTIYGNHTDKVFYYGKMLSKTTEATTGAITLGNAVGYITVNLNGEIVKIPYYGN